MTARTEAMLAELAKLFENGDVVLRTDPAELIGLAMNEIRATRSGDLRYLNEAQFREHLRNHYGMELPPRRSAQWPDKSTSRA